MTHYFPKLSRRATLGWLSAAVIAGCAPEKTKSRAEPAPKKSYGHDPDLFNPDSPWDRTLTPEQLSLVAALADVILPRDGAHPAPSEVGIPEFVDEWVSAPYPDQEGDRATILPGLDWMKARAFDGADADTRIELMAEIAAADHPQHQFFRRLRFIVVGAYYTTAAGFKDIGYIGNVPIEVFPAPSDETLAILKSELEALGFAWKPDR